jgi:hypothetical protein
MFKMSLDENVHGKPNTMDLPTLDHLHPSLSSLIPILSYLFFDKPMFTLSRDFALENKVGHFLIISQLASVAGLSVGALVAARKAKLSPLLNSWGVLSGAFLFWPLSEKFFPLAPVDLTHDVARHRRALAAAAVGAGLSPLFGRGLMPGSQLGLAASWAGEEAGLF